MAGQLIASLDAEFDPERYHDSYRQKVLEMIEAKQRGDESLVTPSEPEQTSTVVDLMAALEASVADAKAARQRHPSTTDAAPAEQATKKAAVDKAVDKASTTAGAKKAAPKKKAAAKKAAAKKTTAKKAVAKKASPQRKSA